MVPLPKFQHETSLPYPREDVFAMHAREGALQRLTPPFVDVRLVREEGDFANRKVELEVRRGPVRFSWKLFHSEVVDGELFRDEQESGPFKSWRHTHRFDDAPDGGCIITDEIEWELPSGGLAHGLTTSRVQAELTRLFRFRRRRIAHDLSRHLEDRKHPKMRIAITGSTGLIGSALSAFLRNGGHEVVPIIRTPGGEGIFWDPIGGMIDYAKLEGLDAVVHLAGEPISGARWTDAKKKAIRESRVRGTALIAGALARLQRPPKVLVSGSAVGYYGKRGEELLKETDSAGKGFLAQVCREWESSAAPAAKAGIRTVILRTGMVLSPQGGALGTMLLPFKIGLGGRLGSGRQYVSWIDLDDLVGLVLYALRTPTLRGPVNATAPHPVTNVAFTDALGRVLHRPTILPVPSLAIRVLFGEMGTELLLNGSRVVPEAARQSGFNFLLPELEESLRFQLGRES